MPRQLPYVVCAFHTDDALYTAACERLRRSLVAFDLPHVIKTIPKVSKWRTADRYKPTFVRLMLEEVKPLDVLYLDADSEVLQYPAAFESFDGSLGLYLRPGKALWSAIAYIKNDERGRKWVRLWEESLEQFSAWHDQRCLDHVVQTHRDDIGGIQALPAEYSRKVGKIGPKTVIAQYQVSNEFLASGGSL